MKMTYNAKDGPAAGIAAATTTLSLFFSTLSSASTASLITVLTTALSDNRIGCGKYLLRVQKVLEDLVLFVFTAVWLFLAGLPYGTLLFWRWINLAYMRARWGSLTDLVDGSDIIGTIDEPTSKQVIMSLKVLKGPFDLEEFRSRCEKSISRRDKWGNLVFQKFHQYLDTIGGYYCWMPAKLDINHHVRIMDGVDPEKMLCETEVMDLLSQHANKPFTKERAPWEILLIPHFIYNKDVNLQSSDLFAMVIRIHHGVGDGFSLMKFIMTEVAGEKPDVYQPPVKNPGKPWPWWYRIFAFFYILWHSPRCFYHEMSVKDSNPLHNALTKVSGEKSIVWSEQISVKWLKELKAEMKVGMNSMLFGAAGGALRAYILEQEYGASKLPSEMTALIPAPAPNHPNNKLTNKFAIVLYPLECKSSDPRVRCAAIEKAAKEIAASPQPHVNLFLAQLIGVAPMMFSKFFIYNTQSTVVFSNLPGPQRSIKIWDAPLIDTMFWLPNVGHSGVSVSFLSYGDKLRIGLTVDKGIIPESHGARHLLNLTVWELEKMARLVGINHKGHGINDDLLRERHSSEDELEELQGDSSTLLSSRRQRKIKRFQNNHFSSSSEDFGFADEESVEDEDEFCRKNTSNDSSAQLEQPVINSVRPRKTFPCATENT